MVEPFIAGYAEGETPNPCVGCNGHVRLDAMLELAGRLGCEWLATGHYARIAEREHEHGPLLRAAADPAKDQTYMLAALAPASLARMRFPLGELTKPEVRELAAAAGLPVAGKADSQDLCFLAGTDRARFLRPPRRAAATGPARSWTVTATVLGAPSRPAPLHGRPAPRARHRPRRPAVRARQGRAPAVRSRSGPRGPADDAGRRCAPLACIAPVRAWTGSSCATARVRSRPDCSTSPPRAATATLAIGLAQPVEGAAPGQLACLMDGELVVGWGTITRPPP